MSSICLSLLIHEVIQRLLGVIQGDVASRQGESAEVFIEQLVMIKELCPGLHKYI